MSQAGVFLTFNPSAAVLTLTGNTGGAVGPTAGNINILGSDGATFTGDPATSTLTLSFNYLALPFTDTIGDGLISFGGTTYIQQFGTNNFFLGPNAGNTTLTVVSAINNNALGHLALNALTIGARNVAIGSPGALQLLTTGSSNIAVGSFSLPSLLTGSDNIGIGDSTGTAYVGAESNNILINNIGLLGESGVIRIGTNGTQTKAFITGIDGVNVGSVATVVTEASDQLGTAVITAGTGITVTPGANTITIAATGAGNPVTTLHTQDGNNVTATAGVINLSGGNNLTTTGTAGPNTATISLTGITQHSLQVGGAANALTQLGVATNGQLPIGSTGADPVLATLTAGSGITISNGVGSITVSATGTTHLNFTSVTTTPYIVLTTDDFLGVTTSVLAITILLPNAPTTGTVWTIKDSTGNAATNNITVTTVGGIVNIDGAATFVMNTAYQAINVLFDGTAYEIF